MILYHLFKLPRPETKDQPQILTDWCALFAIVLDQPISLILLYTQPCSGYLLALLLFTHAQLLISP